MLIVNNAASTTPGSAPTRLALAQSTATSTRSPKSAGRSRRRPRCSNSRNRYSPGSGAGPPRNITTSLPRSLSASPAASTEPSASPSGASWDVTTNRSFSWRAATTACMSLWFDIGLSRSKLVDHLREPHAPLDRGIVFEGQDRGPPGTEFLRELRLQDAVGGLQPFQRPRLRALVAEHADEHRRLGEILRRIDPGHGHEPDPWILQGRQRVREDFPDGLVHLPPAFSARQGRPPPARFE